MGGRELDYGGCVRGIDADSELSLRQLEATQGMDQVFTLEQYIARDGDDQQKIENPGTVDDNNRMIKW